MLALLHHWRDQRRLARQPWPDPDWEAAVADWPVAARYRGQARRQLRDTALRFAWRKQIVAARGMALNEAMILRIATVAAVPVLHLGLDWYSGWYELIVYPEAFIPNHREQDALGIVHRERPVLSGEAWLHGPVIIAWADLVAPEQPGQNVLLHELAHKLDMRQDGANGAPPLPAGMRAAEWKPAFSTAWQQADRLPPQSLPIDDYALTDPGEFFAVLSEHFFEDPATLAATWPAVYRQLSLFYRQDPLAQERDG